ncbi:hypothetical protein QYM36_000175, partial [Artemia franciscana]
MMSVVCITYVAFVMNGGESHQFYLPMFETDRHSGSAQYIGSLFIFYFLSMIISSIYLCVGVHKQLRGFFFPWMILMIIAILFQVVFGLWLICGYYIYLRGVLVAFYCWIWGGLN